MKTAIAISLLALSLALPASALVDPWARVLARHLEPGTKNGIGVALLDYPALVRGDEDFTAALAALDRTDPASLDEDAQMALWINAYNLLAVKLVVENWPLESLRDAGGRLFGRVWDKPAGRVGGRVYTLSEIEHEILRPMGDPRIHAAIVCASVSCPDLRGEPFVAERLEAQLDEQMRRFLARPDKGLRVEGSTLFLSPIFDWFEEDFAAAGGVLAFVRRYAPAGLAIPETPRIEQLDYDWSVNAP